MLRAVCKKKTPKKDAQNWLRNALIRLTQLSDSNAFVMYLLRAMPVM